MPVPGGELDPYRHDGAHWGVSLAQLRELLLPCLGLTGARSVAEVGAYAGDLTEVLLDWAADTGANVIAIDPAPRPALVELAGRHEALTLIRSTSLSALAEIELPDAIVIDGDHNYYTVSAELRLIGERRSQAGLPLPLLLLHDVCWPHARRDDYFDAALIPEADRQPVAGGAGGIFPGDPGLRRGGLPYPRSARREGGPRNGVLSAVEDFVADRPGTRLAIVPAFFGLGVVWDERAAWSDELARLLAPFDRNPILERLEANRVHHLAVSHAAQSELGQARTLLRRMLVSSAFSVAEWLSKLRARAGIATDQTIVSKDEIRRVLGD